jgi:hypothetical protein
MLPSDRLTTLLREFNAQFPTVPVRLLVFWHDASFLHEARATLTDRGEHGQHGGVDLQRKSRWAAWKAWSEKYHAAIVGMGGPLGKTKKVAQHGIEDTNNEMGAYMVVRADSHEAAAKLFENHPHFTIFPGESVEVMPVLPIPAG